MDCKTHVFRIYFKIHLKKPQKATHTSVAQNRRWNTLFDACSDPDISIFLSFDMKNHLHFISIPIDASCLCHWAPVSSDKAMMAPTPGICAQSWLLGDKVGGRIRSPGWHKTADWANRAWTSEEICESSKRRPAQGGLHRERYPKTPVA